WRSSARRFRGGRVRREGRRSVARLDAELLHEALENVAVREAELFPRALLDAIAAIERGADVGLGEILRANARALRFDAVGGERRSNGRREIEDVAFARRERAPEQGFELADAGDVRVLHERAHEIERQARLALVDEALGRARIVGGDAPDEMRREERDVLASLVEPRNRQSQAHARRDVVTQSREQTVGHAEQTEARGSPARVAEALVFAALVEDAKETRLYLLGQLADLVEKEGRSIGFADQARPLRHAGIGIVGEVSEELGVGDSRR